MTQEGIILGMTVAFFIWVAVGGILVAGLAQERIEALENQIGVKPQE